MSWGFADSLAFAAIMTLRDMSKEEEKNRRLIKTQKFYQECYEKITDDSHRAFETVINVARKASRCYTPSNLATGCTYLPLFCFALVIEKQGRITSEQKRLIGIYFDNMTFPFSQSTYLNFAKNGTDYGDFKKIINISKTYAGEFWVNFFRALYKSGTQEDLQCVVDCATTMILRFSVLGNLNNTIGETICRNFVESVNYQINQVREISINEIDWLGVIPIPDRLSEMKKFYETLIDESNITDDIDKAELLPLLELLILNSICDIVMLTKQPKSIKLQMLNEAVALSGIKTDVTPEEYIKHIANNTDLGDFYKQMFSSGNPLGQIWQMILIMGGQTNRREEAIAITTDLLSILLQIENFLYEKYNFLGAESIAQTYIRRIVEKISIMCNEED